MCIFDGVYHNDWYKFAHNTVEATAQGQQNTTQHNTNAWYVALLYVSYIHMFELYM